MPQLTRDRLSRWFEGCGVLIVVLAVSLAINACSHNLAAVILTHRLATTGVIRRATQGPVATDWTADLVRWLPESAGESVLEPWDSLSNSENAERTARALLRAYDARSGFARSLDAWAHAQAPLASPDAVLPLGLAEYEYGLALRAMEQADWRASLAHFERAAVIRPGPWPASFVNRYRESLRHANTELKERLSREETTPPTRIDVGRKDYPGWKVAIESRHGWHLEGFALQSPTAIDLGLPSTARIFWVIDRGQAATQTVRVWNMVPDGGFELNPVPPLSDFGWLQTLAPGRTTSAPRRLVHRSPATSTAAVLVPLHDQSNGILARPIPVNPGAYLLWHA